MFLKNHSFPVLENRLLSSLKGELDSINVLRDVWLEQLGGPPERLVEIYERTNDRNGTQHYENLIDSVLMTFAAEFLIALLANIVADEYHENRDKVLRVIRRLYRKPAGEIVDETKEVTTKYDKALKYLFQVYGAKEYCERNHHTQGEFIRLRESIRQNIYSGEEPLPAEFIKFYELYVESHLLPSLEQSFAEKMGTEFVKYSIEADLEKYSREISSEAKNGTSHPDSQLVFEVKLKGISAGQRGTATGKVSIVLNELDCGLVEKGDVMVVDEMCPDFVSAAKLSVALVSNRGGITSHTAVIGRALNKPTVVGTENATEILKNGVIALVDSRRGIVSVSI